MSDDLWAIAQRLDEAFHAGDLDGIAAFWDDNIDYAAPGLSLQGRAARRLAEQVWLDAFPGARIEVRSHRVIGDDLIIESRMTGVHSGPLQVGDVAIPATGRSICGDYAVFLTFRAGKIVRQRIYFDRLKLMQDLGLAPALED